MPKPTPLSSVSTCLALAFMLLTGCSSDPGSTCTIAFNDRCEGNTAVLCVGTSKSGIGRVERKSCGDLTCADDGECLSLKGSCSKAGDVRCNGEGAYQWCRKANGKLQWSEIPCEDKNKCRESDEGVICAEGALCKLASHQATCNGTSALTKCATAWWDAVKGMGESASIGSEHWGTLTDYACTSDKVTCQTVDKTHNGCVYEAKICEPDEWHATEDRIVKHTHVDRCDGQLAITCARWPLSGPGPERHGVTADDCTTYGSPHECVAKDGYARCVPKGAKFCNPKSVAELCKGQPSEALVQRSCEPVYGAPWGIESDEGDLFCP